MDIPLDVVGEILAGREVGRFVEVIDDRPASGGFLVLTYASAERDPETFDNWVETASDVAAYFGECGWQVRWTDAGDTR